MEAVERGPGLVFLFKSPKEHDTDKFSQALNKRGFSCVSIPVLSFKFINQAALTSCVASLQDFSAVVFTSTRAVQAVVKAAQGVELRTSFTDTQCYVVGETTAGEAKAAGFLPKGGEAGNSMALADFVLQDMDPANAKPILYPCSSIRRDGLIDALKKHYVVTDVKSYETCCNEALEEDLTMAIKRKGIPDYAVFFSPSGFHYVQPYIASQLLPLTQTKIIALGPATYSAIVDGGFSPYATTEKPDPQSLLKIL